MAQKRTKQRKKSIESHGKGNFTAEGWVVDEKKYMDRQENNTLNQWLNIEYHKEIKRERFLSKDVTELLTANSPFGVKMIPIINDAKVTHNLSRKKVIGVRYFVALPGARSTKYIVKGRKYTCLFMQTFTKIVSFKI